MLREDLPKLRHFFAGLIENSRNANSSFSNLEILISLDFIVLENSSLKMAVSLDTGVFVLDHGRSII